jgi:hypothetical protein
MTQAPPLQQLECDRSQCVHTHTLDFSLDSLNYQVYVPHRKKIMQPVKSAVVILSWT